MGRQKVQERMKGGSKKMNAQFLIAAWVFNLMYVWIAKRWLPGETQGYIIFSIMVSYLSAVFVLYEWVVHL